MILSFIFSKPIFLLHFDLVTKQTYLFAKFKKAQSCRHIFIYKYVIMAPVYSIKAFLVKWADDHNN